MYHLSKESRRVADKADLRKGYGLTRRCPHCGRELRWEQDQAGLYAAIDYDKVPHVPHALSCPEIPFK